MSISRWPRAELVWLNLATLLFVFILQVLAVILFVYLGNFVYFKLNPPEDCIIICDCDADALQLAAHIKRYRKQYRLTRIVSYKDPELKPLIRHNDAVFIFNVPPAQKAAIIEYAYKHYTNIYVQADVADVMLNTAKFELMDDMSVLHLPVTELSFEQRFVKRAMDLLVSGIATIILSPLMLVIALAIKLDDHGPVFFKQQRATKDGRIF